MSYIKSRNETLSTYLKNVQNCITIAKDNKNYSKMSPEQQETTLLSAKTNGKTIIDLMNEIKKDNELNKTHLAQLNKQIQQQNIQINDNKNNLDNQKSKINLQEEKDKLSQTKLKNSDKLKDDASIWYIVLMILLVIILLGELYVIVSFIKNNNTSINTSINTNEI